MKFLTLQRLLNHEDGTPGTLGPWKCLEEEDKGNRSNISRIPEGAYVCESTDYIKGGYKTFEVTGVPNRSRILFHRGNTEEHSAGCILVGGSFGALVTKDEDSGADLRKLAVLGSRAAFSEFMTAFRDISTFILVVKDPR